MGKQALNYLFGCFSVNGIGSRLSNISPLPVFFFFLDTVWQAGERVDEARPISTPIQEAGAAEASARPGKIGRATEAAAPLVLACFNITGAVSVWRTSRTYVARTAQFQPAIHGPLQGTEYT